MDKPSYLTENRSYLGDQSGLIELLSEEQFQAVMALTETMGNADPGIDNALVKSAETLSDFDDARTNHWRERGRREETTAAGFKAIIYSDFQAVKGQQRRSAMGVIQFDGFTISLT